MIRGIGVEGVASEIGALGRKDFRVEEEELIKGLCRRFGAERYEAERAIKESIDVCVVTREFLDGKFYIQLRKGGER